MTTYTLDPSSSLTVTLAQNDGANTRPLAYDRVGSLRQMTDGAMLTFNQTFAPYGNPYTKSGSVTVATHLGYTVLNTLLLLCSLGSLAWQKSPHGPSARIL